MEDQSNPELYKYNLILKEQLAGIPKEMRPRFIRMLCEKLGVFDAKHFDQLSERLVSYFDALDAERN
jgi:hypothetical protein